MSTEVALIIVAFVVATALVTIWMVVHTHLSWAKYRKQWEGLQEAKPRSRRAAAKQALKRLKQGSYRQKRRPE